MDRFNAGAKAVVLPFFLLIAAGQARADDGAPANPLYGAMSNRIRDVTDTLGTLPERDASNAIKAGYFRLRIVDQNAYSAAICPDVVYDKMDKADRNRWKEIDAKLADLAFNKSHIWGITANIAVDDGGAHTPSEIWLINIKDPRSKKCTLKLGGSLTSDASPTLDYQSQLIPFSRVAGFNNKITVDLKSAYTEEADPARLKMMWDGLGLIGGLIFAPAAGVIKAAAPVGQQMASDALKKNFTAELPLTFDSDPGASHRSKAMFVKLDFISLSGPGDPPDAAKGGVTIYLEYLASIFSGNAASYQKIDNPSAVLGAQMLTSTGNKTVQEQLAAAVYNSVFLAPDPAAFQNSCPIMKAELDKLGLSAVDRAVFLWAVASTNPNTKDKLYAIQCLVDAQPDLTKVQIAIPPRVPETRLATYAELKAALDNLATMMRSGGYNDDLATRFADKIYFYADGETGTRLNLGNGSNDKVALLTQLSTNFGKLGCYGPRDSRPDLILNVRPNLGPLGDKERAAAAITSANPHGEQGAIPYIISLRFAPVQLPTADNPAVVPAKVTGIFLTRRDAGNDDVLRELTDGRRPQSCTESWMDGIFAH